MLLWRHDDRVLGVDLRLEKLLEVSVIVLQKLTKLCCGNSLRAALVLVPAELSALYPESAILMTSKSLR